MANPYRILFQASGTRAFSLAGLLARLPLPMTGIGIITMLSQLRGSYALAGAVSATFVLTYALMSPQVSRMVDRYGQRRVLPLSAGLSVVGLLLLLACTHWHTPDWTLFLAAVLAGFMPSMSAMVRARWTAIYRGKPHLQTAYSLETVLDEVTFSRGAADFRGIERGRLSPGRTAGGRCDAGDWCACFGGPSIHRAASGIRRRKENENGLHLSLGGRATINIADGRDGRHRWNGRYRKCRIR